MNRVILLSLCLVLLLGAAGCTQNEATPSPQPTIAYDQGDLTSLETEDEAAAFIESMQADGKVKGERLIDQKLKTPSGEIYNTADQRGKVLVLVFITASDPYSAALMPNLAKALECYGEDGPVEAVLIVDSDPGTGEAEALTALPESLIQQGIPQTLLFDESGLFFKRLSEASLLPMTVVIDGEGYIKIIWDGVIETPETIRQIIDSVLFYGDKL